MTSGGATVGRILLVDDDTEICRFVSMLLQLEGFVPVVTQTAEQALRELDAGGVELVLLDIAMPDVDGIDLCRRIRTNPSTSKVPVLMVSARPGEDVIRRARDAGANDFIRKPFENDDLVSQIRRHTARVA